MDLTFGKYLEEFRGDIGEPAYSLDLGFRSDMDDATSSASVANPIAESHASGVASGRAAARAEHETELLSLRDEHKRQIDQLSMTMGTRLSEQLMKQIDQRFQQLYETLSGDIAVALMPVLRYCLTEAAVRELVRSLQAVLRPRAGFAVEISGPEDVVRHVWHRYCEAVNDDAPEHWPEVCFKINDAAEVQIVVNNTVIESRLSEWIAKISEAAG